MKRLEIKRLVMMIPVAVLLSVVLSCAIDVEGSGRERVAPSASARAKSRHYYLRGAQSYGEGKYDNAYEYYRKAYESDPTNSEAAVEYAIHHRAASIGEYGDTVGMKEAYRNAGNLTEQYPGDFFTVYDYISLASSMGEMEDAVKAMERFMELNPGHTAGLEALTDLYLDSNQIEKALETISQYERIEGTDVKTTIRKAGIHLAANDTVGAVSEAEKLIEEHPNEPEYYVLKGQIESYVGREDAALRSLRKAEELSEPGSGGAAKMQMSEIYRQRGDSVEYERKVYEALLTDDLPFEMKHDLLAYYLSNQLKEGKDSSKGDALFETLLEQYPHEPALQSLASRYSAAKQDYGEALDQVEYAIDLDPSNEEYRNDALRFAYLSGDYEAMERVYKEIEGYFQPVSSETMVLYGQLLSAAEKYDAALEVFQELIGREFPGIELNKPLDMSKLDKNMDMKHLNLLVTIYQDAGDIYNLKYNDDHTLTFACYENVLKLIPDNALTLNNYAYFMTRDKDRKLSDVELEKALRMSEEALKGDPGNPTYMDTRAWVLYRSGEYEAAREMIEAALEAARQEESEAAGEETEDPSHVEYYDHYGDILDALGEGEAARVYWKKALHIEPDNEKIKQKLKTK